MSIDTALSALKLTPLRSMRIEKYGHGSTRPPGEQNALLVHFHQPFIYRKQPSRIGRPVGPSLELSVTQIATRRSGVHSRRVQTRGMCGTSLFLLGWPLVVTRQWRVTKKRKFVAQERDRACGSALWRPGAGHRCILCPLTCFWVQNYPFRVAA